jgi:hypothetical protein
MEKKKEKRKKTGGRRAGTPNKVNAHREDDGARRARRLGGQKWLKKQAQGAPAGLHDAAGQDHADAGGRGRKPPLRRRIPAPAENPEEWLKTYAPPPLTAKKH